MKEPYIYFWDIIFFPITSLWGLPDPLACHFLYIWGFICVLGSLSPYLEFIPLL